ncbi:hypothetical protein [Prochlorothrix hollandica]|uniref:Uncharacterized protein n=1 Tax=Prochlorothrix hollandica PCC 9006 = CALU 1027 TaxID=317619 RepID=A0A0M2PWC8_PROHO|nr:hypothetical protein [Prochlorothrix hollandica]KKI99387.1 hypothetical protein PROH_15535 [Prochlorothrix hollandica PCC 9006 = CALU 1027]
MVFLRQVVAPFLIVLVFLVALAAVSARIWLPADMAAPAPVDPADRVAVELYSPPSAGETVVNPVMEPEVTTTQETLGAAAVN